MQEGDAMKRKEKKIKMVVDKGGWSAYPSWSLVLDRLALLDAIAKANGEVQTRQEGDSA